MIPHEWGTERPHARGILGLYKDKRKAMIKSNDNKRQGEQARLLRLDEKQSVETPFMEQLRTLGWDKGENEVLALETSQTPEQSYRRSLREVVLLPKLTAAVKRINPWLTEGQAEEVVARMTSFASGKLIDNNREVLRLLLEGTTVSRNEQTGDLSPEVRYIDFRHPENNVLTAISQFKVAIPATEHHIIPDIVLFINGLPIVVVEAKSPKLTEPIAEAIDQMMRYSEQRDYVGEGCQELFAYNQILIATCRNESKFGTITAQTEKYFYRWTDPYPMTVNELRHGQTSPNDQQRLVAGMLAPQNLLDILRVFTIFKTDDKGKTVKIVGRYQQFRAVKKMAERLKTGQTKQERGGILWHTQGSGKSLTMMFLVRQMRIDAELAQWKIVLVTDRTQLEKQLGETGTGVGFALHKAERIDPMNPPRGNSLKELLSTDSSDLVMAMIHKFQETGELGSGMALFPILNTSERILIMTDEAHRSQYSLLGANLDRALPNATKIGFTGTPTAKTERLYKDYIDRYTMRESIDDGVTLEIIYQGFTRNAEIDDKQGADHEFEDVFSDYNIVERLQILGFGSRDAYLDSEVTILAKARSMMQHYVSQIFSGGFKAQIVANSRMAVARYKEAVEEALQEEIAKLEQSNPNHIDLDTLREVKAAVVISGDRNDPPQVKQYIDKAYHERSIKSFKLPFGSQDEDDHSIKGDVGIIIVNNMLTTGFDAPIEQVLYLDKVIVAHNLLQTIARPNRKGPVGKDYGFVVDYVGIGHHLRDAILKTDEKQQQVDSGEIESIIAAIGNDEQLLKQLAEAHKAIMDFIKVEHGITDLTDEDAFYDLFYDEKVRDKYIELYRKLSAAFNALLPAKEVLTYYEDWLTLTEINALAMKHLHDGRLSMKGLPPKLLKIADAYLQDKGIDEQVKPISIMAEDFIKEAQKRKRDKTKAAQVEHAIRNYIDINIDEDPELFASFSKAIEEILKNFHGNWKKIYEELEKLRERIRQREQEATYGLNRKSQMPFFRIFKAELWDNRDLTEDEIGLNVALTLAVSAKLQTELKLVGFWDNTMAQNKLKAYLQNDVLLSKDFYSLPGMMQKYKQLISRIMEVARANHNHIVAE